MTTKPSARFELQRVTTVEWIICDGHYRDGDARRLVACVREMDPAEYEVIWLRDLALPRWYESPQHVLDDVLGSVSRAHAPIRIAHRPPLQHGAVAG